MKIFDYGLSAHYVAKPEIGKKSELMYILSHKEPWPNELVQINGINLMYNGFHLAQLYAENDSGYSAGSKSIVMLYGFPTSGDTREDSDKITFNMLSRKKDLRPILYKVLLDDCRLVVKLPKTDYQQIFCKSLLSCLEIK